MPDPESTWPPTTRAQRILDDLNRGEGAAARAAGAVGAWMAAHPHAAWILFLVLIGGGAWLGYLVGRL